jgi:hypothetical protein
MRSVIHRYISERGILTLPRSDADSRSNMQRRMIAEEEVKGRV